MKRSIISFILGMAIMLPIGTYAAAQIKSAQYNDTKISLNGQLLSIATPFVTIVEQGKVNGFNVAPIRAIFEAMGYKVDWNKPSNTIELKTPRTDLQTVVKNCKDSCVMIYAYKDDKVISQGSGWIYNGNVVTAKHVLEGANKFAVFTDDSTNGQIYTEAYRDDKFDIAIIKTNLSPSVKLGDSSKLIEGEKLVAITSPLGAMNIIDECVYSGTKLTTHGNEMYLSENEMDRGSSGGAAFNSKSEIIGINTNGEGDVSSLIPINDIKSILKK